MPSASYSQEITPISISFEKMENGCKVFKIDSSRGVSSIFVSDFSKTIKTPTSDPPGTRTSTELKDTFDYKPGRPGSVTLTICPEDGKDKVDFSIWVTTGLSQSSRLSVIEKKAKTGVTIAGSFSESMETDKKNPVLKLPVKGINAKDVKIETKPGLLHETQVHISGNVTDISKPALVGAVLDPPNEFILFVVDVCIESNHEEALLCPDFVPIDLRIDLPLLSPIGGEILGIDMPTLLVAGAFANASWILPVIAGTAALAIIGVKQILK